MPADQVVAAVTTSVCHPRPTCLNIVLWVRSVWEGPRYGTGEAADTPQDTDVELSVKMFEDSVVGTNG